MTDKHTSLQCPNCKSNNVARVRFGMPDFNDKLQEELDNGTIVLGGCSVSDSDPNYCCNDCKHQWRRDGKRVEFPIELDDNWL